MIQLSDQDLLARMKNFEDHFVERKTSGDSKDWLSTAVAFANSAPIGAPCVLYIGVKDTGEIETPQVNLDNLQKTFNRKMQNTYPRVPYFPKIVSDNGRQALAVIVYGSELRPHFTGQAYVRKGSESVEASDQLFEELIASRNSKVRMILVFKDKPLSVVNRYHTANGHLHESHWGNDTRIVACNTFWVTLASRPDANTAWNRQSFPLNRVTLSFDEQKNLLRLEIGQ